MLIDLLFGCVLILAIWRGWRQGLIVGLFSLIAVFIGLAAALKLSAVVATHLGIATRISEAWLPFISFFIVFIIVLLLVRLAAKALEKTAELAMLGWLNKLGGIICFVLLYTTVFSILLFYADKMKVLPAPAFSGAASWPYLKQWGPGAIEVLARIIPWFSGMFKELEGFFSGVSTHIK